MAFGQDFLKGFFGADSLRDYAHASKTFRTNGYELAPRYKFLFHVYFTINQDIPGIKDIFDGNSPTTIGLMVKTIQLPNYSMSVDTMNQYNRKRLVQTKIEYNPVTIEFHDDGGDVVRNMWYNYYSYYYKDPNQKYYNVNNQNGALGPLIQNSAGFSYNNRDTYIPRRDVNDWGYIGESFTDGCVPFGDPGGKPPFFRDIRIYGFDQHKFAHYVLINPMITEWRHDTYDYSQGNGTMSHNMTIKYETVKYYTGAVGKVRPDTNAIGFADPAYYDTVRSPLSRPGSQATVLGQGGLIDAGVGIIQDLQSGGVAGAIGAVQKAGAVYNTFKDKNIRAIVNNEAQQAAVAIARQALPGAARAIIGSPTPVTTPSGPQVSKGALDGVFFPTPPRTTGTSPVQGGTGFVGGGRTTTGGIEV